VGLILPTIGIRPGERTRTYICAIVRPGTRHPVLLRIDHFPQLSLADAHMAARQMMIAGAPPSSDRFGALVEQFIEHGPTRRERPLRPASLEASQQNYRRFRAPMHPLL
jgi:hypothetical protein